MSLVTEFYDGYVFLMGLTTAIFECGLLVFAKKLKIMKKKLQKTFKVAYNIFLWLIVPVSFPLMIIDGIMHPEEWEE